MTPRLHALVTALIALLLATLPAAGQGTPTTTWGFDLTELPGLQRAVSRTYTFDPSILIDTLTTPSSTQTAPTGTIFMGGIIAEFDAQERAVAALEAIEQEPISDLGGQDLEPELQPAPVDDLGDRGLRLSGSSSGEPAADIAVYVVQDDRWLYVALVISTSGTSDITARGLIQFVLEHEASDDEGQFSVDGTSEGGLWSKLPTIDDLQQDEDDEDENVLAGTIPLTDTVIFPLAPGSTPGA